MGITKNNKRDRRVTPKVQKRRNSNLVRIPRDNRIWLAVWDEQSQRATLTELSTEEAGNVAMYLAKNKKVVGPHGQEMVSKANKMEQENKLHLDMLQVQSDQIHKTSVDLRKVKRHNDSLKQTLSAMVNNQRTLLDVVQNMVANPVYEYNEPMSSQDAAHSPGPGMMSGNMERKSSSADLLRG